MPSEVAYPGTEKNPWLSRARKAIIAALTVVVEIANVYANGPEWLYVAAPAAATVLVYLVGNAPKYKDPRPPRVTAQ